MNEKKTEERYWNDRYRAGGTSGKGSIGDYRKWKWKVIEQYVDVTEKTVTDVGCGDMTFLKGKKFKRYVGIDISPAIIENHRKAQRIHQEKFRHHTFFRGDATEGTGSWWRWKELFCSEVVLCMDLLFHIMDDERFGSLLDNLNMWTGEWLFVVSWRKNPLSHEYDHYQYYRDLKAWLDRLPDLELVAEHEKKGDPYNTLYVFRRREA